MEETPLSLLNQRNKAMHSAESITAGRAFVPRDSDVFVTTYPKCGTTWVTQICHSLRTGEITEVCWWDILAKDCDQDLNANQVASPRIFKSHEKFQDIAKRRKPKKSCKYIHVARNPFDAFVSFYYFLPGFMGLQPGALTMKEFCDAIFAGVSHSGGIWSFFDSWYSALLDPDVNVLWIFFEDLKHDLETQVRKIADFISLKKILQASGGDGSIEQRYEERIKVTVSQSRHSFMKEHVEKFDEHFVFGKRKAAMGLEDFEKPLVAKVRADGDNVGSRKIIPEEITRRLQEKWKDIIETRLGFKTYEEFHQEVRTLEKLEQHTRAYQ